MPSTTRIQRTYDHRLRELVRSTADVTHATRLGVPRSTARGWLRPRAADVVTLDVADKSVIELQQEVVALRCRLDRLRAVLHLLIAVLKVSGFTLASARVSENGKRLLLRLIERTRAVLPLRVSLRVLGLSHSRYYLGVAQPSKCFLQRLLVRNNLAMDSDSLDCPSECDDSSGPSFPVALSPPRIPPDFIATNRWTGSAGSSADGRISGVSR